MALLAYLATTGQAVGREILAGLLWPEFGQTRARANLRRTLYTLNQTPLAHWLRSEAENLALEPGKGDSVDVRRFDQLLQEGTPEALVEAAALYKADFLEGFSLPDSVPFDEWRTIQQQAFQRQALEILDQLTGQRLEKGDYRAAEEYARRQIEIDDLREPAWRQLMTALTWSGRRSEALVEYERCRQLLWDELGVEPAAETAALGEEIRTFVPEDVSQQVPSQEAPVASLLETSATQPDLSLAQLPYRGLFAFKEEDAPFFFGREAFTEMLTMAVDDQSILPVIGPSGSGKSSVIYAGLVARLKETTDWVVASFRPGQRPMQALAACLVPLLDDGLSEIGQLEETNRLASALSGGSVTLYNVVERIREKWHSERLVLVADQFEELYTLVHEADLRQRFLDVLLELVFMQQYRPAPVFTLTLTLRADFLGQALAYRPLADAFQDVDVKLGPMTEAELKRAVTQPAQRLGATFEAGLVSRILGDVGHEPGSLPLLEFALANLWEQQTVGQLTHAAYEAIGGVEGALARYADHIFTSLKPDEQIQARRVLVQLVRPGEGTEDTRRLATRAELDNDWQLVQQLADARLVITGRDPGGIDTVEIVHEALIQKWGRFREWIANDREFRLWQERLRVVVGDWQRHNRDDSSLLRGIALNTAENWLADRPDDLSRAEKAFISAGIALRQKQEEETVRQMAERERLRRRFTRALGAGMLLAMILATVAVLQWRSASRDRDAARTAFARQLAAQSQAMVGESFDLSLLLAVEAVNLGNESTTMRALNDLLAYSPSLAQFLHLPDRDYSEIIRAGLREDGLLALGDQDSITLWDVYTGQATGPEEIISKARGSSPIVFSPDGNKMAVFAIQDEPLEPGQESQLGGARVVEIYSLDDGGLVQTIPANVFANTIAFSPNSQTLAVTSLSTIQLWDLDSGQLMQGLEGGELAFVDFSPDGHLVAGSGARGRLLVWDVDSGDVLVNQQAHGTAIFATAFSPEGRFLVTAAEDGTIRFWESSSWSAIGEAIRAHEGPFMVAFSPDGTTVVSAGEDGVVRRWVTSTGEPYGQPFSGHQPGTLVGLTFSPSGETLLTAMMTGAADEQRPQIIAWRPEQAPIKSLIGHHDAILAASFGPEAELITSVAANGEVLRWRTSGRHLGLASFIDWSGVWWGGGLSPDGRWIARGSRQGGVVIHDSGTGRRQAILDEPPLPIADIDFTADSRWIAGAGCAAGSLTAFQCQNGRTWVWEVESGQLVGATTFDAANMVHNDVAISADGQLAASGAFAINGSESLIALWDVASGKMLAEQEGRANGDLSHFGLAFSPDRGLLAGNGPASFKVWEIGDEGQLSERLTITDRLGITAAVFSPDGRRLVTGETDGLVAVWDVNSGELLAQEGTTHNDEVTTLRFNSDGSLLVSGSRDGSLVLFDMAHILDMPEEVDMATIKTACSRANRNLTETEWRRFFAEEPYRETCSEFLR